jgi:hypothetical protein
MLSLSAYLFVAVASLLLGIRIGRNTMADFSRVSASLNALSDRVTRAIAVITSPDADQASVDAVESRIETEIARLDEVLPAPPPPVE